MSPAPVNIVLTMPRTRKQWTLSLAAVGSVLLVLWAILRWGYLRHEDAILSTAKDVAAIRTDMADAKTATAVQTVKLDGIDTRLARIEDAIFRTIGAKTASYQPPLAPAPRVAQEIDRQ